MEATSSSPVSPLEFTSTKEEPTSNPPSPVKSHSPDSVIVHPSATNDNNNNYEYETSKSMRKMQKVFSTRPNLLRHIRNYHETVQISKNVIRCGQGSFICNEKLTRKDNLIKHLKTKHPSSQTRDCTVYICDHCSYTFSKISNLIRHIQNIRYRIMDNR